MIVPATAKPALPDWSSVVPSMVMSLDDMMTIRSIVRSAMESSIVRLRIDASWMPTNWTASRRVLLTETFSGVRPVVGLGAYFCQSSSI